MNLDDRTRAEWLLLRLANYYAKALDRRDSKLLETLFTEDGVFAQAGSPNRNRAEICQIPIWLGEECLSTLHTVLNQTMEITGDSAEGETYCIAYHIIDGAAGTTISVNKAIRYQDSCVRIGDDWRFRRRELICDWTEIRQVRLGGAPLR